MEISITRKGEQGSREDCTALPVGERMRGINGWRLSASVIPAATGPSHQTVKIEGLSDTEVEFSLSLLGAKLSKPPLGKPGW